jgi:hypothetical protein
LSLPEKAATAASPGASSTVGTTASGGGARRAFERRATVVPPDAVTPTRVGQPDRWHANALVSTKRSQPSTLPRPPPVSTTLVWSWFDVHGVAKPTRNVAAGAVAVMSGMVGWMVVGTTGTTVGGLTDGGGAWLREAGVEWDADRMGWIDGADPPQAASSSANSNPCQRRLIVTSDARRIDPVPPVVKIAIIGHSTDRRCSPSNVLLGTPVTVVGLS